jgi:uncharacterized protein DUF4397
MSNFQTNARSAARLTVGRGDDVLNFRVRLGTLVACAAFALAACGGGGGSSGSANVRLVNATSTHASLNLLSNGNTAVSGAAQDTVSSYAGVDAGSPTLQINDATSGSALATLAPSVSKDAHYVVIAYESSGALRTTVIAEDTAAPSAGTASLRLFDAATDAGAVDVYITDPSADLTASSPSFSFGSSVALQASAFLSFAPGTYRIRVTGAGNTADLRLDMPSVALTDQEIANVLLTPTSGGTLVNGAVLSQQSTYTAGRNTNARVRLAAAVSGGAHVSASAGAVAIASNVASPSVSGYVLVPAGSALNVSVNGNSVGAPAAAISAGSDSTLLVYGAPAASTASLITDDNHLPASTSNLKLRIVNGLTGSAQPVTLDAAFAVIANNVQPGTASPYALVASSTALQIDVFVPSSVTPIYTSSSSSTPLSLPGNAVYTLFMLGDAGSPIALLRRDR